MNTWMIEKNSMKKIIPIVTESYIRGRKLNISLVFITQSYFAVPKNIGLNSAHIFFNEMHYLIIHQGLNHILFSD